MFGRDMSGLQIGGGGGCLGVTAALPGNLIPGGRVALAPGGGAARIAGAIGERGAGPGAGLEAGPCVSTTSATLAVRFNGGRTSSMFTACECGYRVMMVRHAVPSGN